jgi:gliding motility-associated-like protein
MTQKNNTIFVSGILAIFFLFLGLGTSFAQCTSPVITSIVPASGPANTVVTITGSNFETTTGITAVRFNNVNALGFTVVSNTVIKAIVPATATNGAITVVSGTCTANSSVFSVLSSQCQQPEIYISEIYDAYDGTPGAIELYNPGSTPVNLNGYRLLRYGNIGQSTPAEYNMVLTGTINPEDVFIIAININAACSGINTDFPLTNGINANDEFELLKNNVLIDNVEIPLGTDDFLGKGYSLIRHANAVAPKVAFNQSDWNVLGEETCTFLGYHVADPALGNATVSTQPQNVSICENGQASFAITVSPSAGFTYQWKTLNGAGNWVNVTNGGGITGAATATLNINPVTLAMNGNQYYCQATSSSCTLVSNAALLTVSPLPLATIALTQPTCTTATGSIIMTPVLGDGLTYQLDAGPFVTTTTFSGIAPGNHTLTIKSSASCTTVMPFVINPVPAAPAQPVATPTQPTCTAAGSITVNSPTGNGEEYSLDGTTFQTGTTFGNLTAGTYNVTVRIGGCTAVSANITINTAPGAPAVAATTEAQPTCTIATGTITVTAPLGSDLEYSLDGTTFQDSPLFSVADGTYTVTVRNAAGCTSVTGNIVINPAPAGPAAPTVTTGQPDCTVAGGTITITAPLGIGLEYSIDGTNFQSSPLFITGAGTYTVTVRNAAGCTATTANIVIVTAPVVPSVPVAGLIQPDCTTPTGTITITFPTGNNLEYSIDGTNFQTGVSFPGLTPGHYTITVRNTIGGCTATGTTTINAVPNAPVQATLTPTQPTCAVPSGTITVDAPAGLEYSLDGITFQTGTSFPDLIGGTYTVTTRNASGCISVSNPVTINQAPAAPAVASTTPVQPTCVLPTGTISITAPAGLEYSLDGTNFVTTTTFAGLSPGNYTVTVRNADGCTSVTPNITIDAIPAAPQAGGVQECRSGIYTLDVAPLSNSFNPANATYEWRDAAGTVIGSDENTFNVSQYVADNNLNTEDFPLTFTVTVTTEAGCQTTYPFTVENSFCTIPKGISPNNDTLNDSFDIAGLQARKVSIFNRYGQEVYSRKNYTNEWRGQNDKGDDLPTGTYYYMIETSNHSYTGWVYLNRQEN